MKDILKYVVKETKRHFHTRKHYVHVFGKRRDISPVVTALKVAVEATSAYFFIQNLLG